MLGNAHAYSAAVCANVAAEARKRLEEGDLDNIIRTRFFEVEMNAAFVDLPTPPPLPPATPVTGSRMIRQLGDVVRLTGKGEPFEAMASLLRELRELREFKKAILASTEKASSEAAIASVRQAMGERNVLKEAETGLGASLGSDGWRTASRHDIERKGRDALLDRCTRGELYNSEFTTNAIFTPTNIV